MSAPKLPRATCRLQLRPEFDLDTAAAAVPYLGRLGVSHLYLSPIFRARPGSTHFYDVVDPNTVAPELGGGEALHRLAAAARQHGLGLILDFVPNHMATHKANAWWLHVLEWGLASPYARFFGVDWHVNDPQLAERILMPILGETLEGVLAEAALRLRFDPETASLMLTYYEHELPLKPHDYGPLLRAAGEDFAPLAEGFEAAVPSDPESVLTLKSSLARRLAEDGEAGARLAAALEGADLGRLARDQVYVPSPWRESSARLNYRRFFDIDHLIGLRMEDPATFEATHACVLDLAEEGVIDGLRLDHVDGLFDPAGYLQRLNQAWRGRTGREPLLWVEKILGPEETLRADWPITGTTGYEVLGALDRVLVPAQAETRFEALWTRVASRVDGFGEADFHAVARAAKRLLVEEYFGPETTRLAGALSRFAAALPDLAETDAPTRRRAIEALAESLDVYRSYLRAGVEPDPQDLEVVERAVAKARHLAPGNPALEPLAAVLRGEAGEAAGRAWAMQFQQVTGPIMAKSLEDTAFYRHARLLALNEVGGEPDLFSLDADAFHLAMQARRADQPGGLTTTATHDHKRGEDARARLLALTHAPEAWNEAFTDLEAALARLCGGDAPDAIDRALLIQTLVASWPVGCRAPGFPGLGGLRARVQATMEKGLRESKRHSSWVAQDGAYEETMRTLIDRALDPAAADVPARLEALMRWVAPMGATLGLIRTVLKFTVPGVPDIYQGREMWDTSLVDPDNRALVDYAELERLWEQAGAAASRVDADTAEGGPDWEALARGWADGRIKQALTTRLLALRAADPELWAEGAYRPLPTAEPGLIGFRRVLADRWAAVIVPCRVAPPDGAAPLVGLAPPLLPERAGPLDMPGLPETLLEGLSMRSQAVEDIAVMLGAAPLPALVLLSAPARRGPTTG